jgi:hypothetical protein
MLGAGAYSHSQLSKLSEAGQPTLSAGVLWTSIIVGIVMLFAVVGPMVLLGVFVAAKIMKFPLSSAAYLKACGVAALPLLLLRLTHLLPYNLPLRILAMIAILPAVFYVVKTTYELTLPEGGVAFLISGITGIIGLVIAGIIIGLVAVGGVVGEQIAKQPGGGNAGGIGATNSVIPPLPGVTTTTPKTSPGITNSGPTKSTADAFRDTLASRVAMKPDTSREAQQKELVTLKAQAESTGAAKRADVLNLLQELENRAAAAPSEKPEPAIFQEPVATNTWKPSDAMAGALQPDELSYKGFNFRLPKGFRADLDSSEATGKGLSFSTPERDGGKLTFRTVPAENAKQRRPWVTRASFQTAAAEAEKLFTIDGTGAAAIEEGAINGVPFTRVLHQPGKRWGVPGSSVQYVTRTADGWVIADAVASSSSSGGVASLEASIRTLRPRPAGDPKSDPFAVEALVARFGEDPDRVASLIREKGKVAEDSVIPLLKSEDRRTARAAASLLGDIGTTKSVAPLQEASRASDSQLAQAAREAVKKLQPDAMDAVAEALIDLESTDHFKQSAALAKLAKMTPDDARREKVATAIENQVLGKDLFFIYKDAGPALGAWAGKNTVSRLLPLLANERATPHERQVAMEVLGKVKDKRGVLPVVRWILLDTENATKSLIEMGPIAEDEVIKLVKGPDAAGRTAAARILQEIGTIKSMAALKRASLDQRDANAAVAAKVALDIVSERLKEQKAAGGTTAPAQ